MTEMIAVLRRVELRWARRCWWALVIWTLCIFSVVFAVLLGLAGKKEGWF